MIILNITNGQILNTIQILFVASLFMAFAIIIIFNNCRRQIVLNNKKI